MIQRFIELGEGYNDVYELLEIARTNEHRIQQLLLLHTEKNNHPVVSFVVVLQPSRTGNFQPLYTCREGIPYDAENKNKRVQLFEELSETVNLPIISLEVKPSSMFKDKELYYNHLIGILRLNNLISPLS
ncbi:DUF7147 family protein [Pseudalkalibacillus caeni]|uniref:Methylthioribose kinase n=1 Tax=Exobacillus caeni TaxID=2574798 RepID=A0A5R9F593_9BACL|nr:methylthioribose kinase [Pseudalkalibacillus caeni]TLS37649.1 methylthioribose kinase [Pseudalkalibacillus caeni]